MTQQTLNRCRWTVAAIVAIALPALAPAPAAASEADFFKGKTVSVVIGFAPGAGYDLYLRSLSRHMGKHIPGSPNLVPRNMPGAGSIIAANHLYNQAPKDGTAFGTFASSTAFAPLFGEERARFDPRKFTWLGNLDQTIGTCTVWHTSGIKSFDELMTREVIFGASGPTAVTSEHPRGFNAILKTRLKIIHGYNGASGVLLAMKRGELHGGCGFALSSLKAARRQEWESGELRVIIQTGYEKSDELKGVPHIYDYARTEEQRQLFDLIYGRHIIGRPVAAPPGLAAERAKTLRDAVKATIIDAAFLEEAKKLHLDIAFWDADKLTEVMNRFLNYPETVVAQARKAMEVGKIVNVELKSMQGTISAKAKKGRITVTGADGKSVTMRVADSSEVSVAGKEAEADTLAPGMTCSFQYFGEGDLAQTVTCK